MVNAFWLDRDLEQAARWLVDAHVTSSIMECAIALTTSAQQVGGSDLREDPQKTNGQQARESGHPEHDDLYFGFPDHPLTEWAKHSFANWRYLHEYTRAAHDEWRYRWDHDPGDQHASWTTLQSLDHQRLLTLDWPADNQTDPPQLTGDWTAPDYVDAYRFYYANDKRHLFEWTKDRERPPWIEAYTMDAEA